MLGIEGESLESQEQLAEFFGVKDGVLVKAVTPAIVMLLALVVQPGTPSFAEAVATATTIVTAVPTATATAIAGQSTQAVAYQINPAHTGAAQLPSLVPPLVQK